MSQGENLVYRGPVRIYYAKPVLRGDNESFMLDASVYSGSTPNSVGIHNHGTGSFHIITLDHVADLILEDWEEGQSF